ncbi:MAG: c-type cytochrome, partial [Deltaproteobacteria bacterium]
EEPGLHDIWGHLQRPRDLSRGIYRGGRRPVDIYRRVHQGIPGTQMNGFAKLLQPEEIWDVVNYVLSIPFDGQQSAYPADLKEEEEAGKQKVAVTEE